MDERRIPASHPDFPKINELMNRLGQLLNPWCWFGMSKVVEEMGSPEHKAAINITKDEIRKQTENPIKKNSPFNHLDL